MDSKKTNLHEISSMWNVWVHMPNERNWDINSYRSVANINTLEEAIEFSELISDISINKCMIFIMRDGILPMWEDKMNINGGAFSFKVTQKAVPTTFRRMLYRLVGSTLSDNMNKVHGISISPKKQFSILKVWVGSDAETMKICESEDMSVKGTKAMYRRHKTGS